MFTTHHKKREDQALYFFFFFNVFMPEKHLENQIVCIWAVFMFFFLWLESEDDSDVLPWAGFLAFLSYDIMFMTLGICIAFLPSFNILRDGMAHNEKRSTAAG